ncbi:MAG TPA: hypothetical protein VMS35_06550 [Nitrososphaeraceae archaeon]|nr:hypothetical protein [Nitrososphaeraceae archaeon]
MTLLCDPSGIYFQDKRRCYWCNHFIKITELYDFVVVGCSGLKVYFCEECLETHPGEAKRS